MAIVLKRTDEMFDRVRTFDRSNRTIFIGSGAAVQLPNLISLLTRYHPEATISSELKKPYELKKGPENHKFAKCEVLSMKDMNDIPLKN